MCKPATRRLVAYPFSRGNRASLVGMHFHIMRFSCFYTATLPAAWLALTCSSQEPTCTPIHTPMPQGTIIEVNVSELGLVTPGGKVVWGKYAQVTNNPENDGCINAVLLV